MADVRFCMTEAHAGRGLSPSITRNKMTKMTVHIYVSIAIYLTMFLYTESKVNIAQ